MKHNRHIAELGHVNHRRSALLDSHLGGPLPAGVIAELDQLGARNNDILDRIEEEDHRRQMEAAMEAIAAAMGSPFAYSGPMSLVRQGWEVQGGHFYAPDYVSGGLVRMWPINVLADPLPDDPARSGYYKRVRLSLEPTYRQAFTKWVSACVRLRDPNMAWAQLAGSEQNALSEGTDTAGGAAVPADWQAVIQARLGERSIFRRYATVRQTIRDHLTVPRFQEHATEGSVYSSGFVGDWVGETPSQSDINPSFGSVAVWIFKARAKTTLSSDLADDAPELASWLTVNGSENLAIVEDRACISGDGNLKPLGLLNGGSPTIDVEGSTANTISNTTAAQGSAPKIEDLEGALPDQYAVNARWLMRRVSERNIRKLVDAQSRFHFPVTRAPNGERLLMDYPVTNSTALDAEGTDANRVAVLGDLRGYVLAHRAITSLLVSRERYADTDQVLFILLDRVGGVVSNPDAFRIGIV